MGALLSRVIEARVVQVLIQARLVAVNLVCLTQLIIHTSNQSEKVNLAILLL